jgi:hypothetical protein
MNNGGSKMEWTKKVEMVKSSNNKDTFYKFLNENVDEIVSDIQALDMMINSIELSEVDIENNLEFFEKIIIKEEDRYKLSLRSDIRYGVLLELVGYAKDGI